MRQTFILQIWSKKALRVYFGILCYTAGVSEAAALPLLLAAASRLKTDLGSASFAATLYTGELAKPKERLIYIQLPDS